MIRLIFTRNREVFLIEIENKIIKYSDRKLAKGFQLMPLQKDYKEQIIFSRNKIPSFIQELVEESNSGEGLKQYQEAKSDDELVPIIKKDAGSKGCKFEKQEIV